MILHNAVLSLTSQYAASVPHVRPTVLVRAALVHGWCRREDSSAVIVLVTRGQ